MLTHNMFSHLLNIWKIHYFTISVLVTSPHLSEMCLTASGETYSHNTDTQKVEELSVTETPAENCAPTIKEKGTGFSVNVDWPLETAWEVFSQSCTSLDSCVDPRSSTPPHVKQPGGKKNCLSGEH